MINVDPTNYFPFLSVSSVSTIFEDMDISRTSDLRNVNNFLQNDRAAESNQEKEIKRNHYKIAYLILAHNNKLNLLELLKHLYSKDAIFLIHIDGKYPEVLIDVRNFIKNDFEHNGNVYVIEKPFLLSWYLNFS